MTSQAHTSGGRRRIGVAGATGRVGGAVLAELLAREVRDVVALSRSALGVTSSYDGEQRRLDYDEPTSLREAFGDLDTLVFPGSDGDPEQMLRQHRAVVAAARQSPVRRVIYLSSVDAVADTPFCYARVHGATEALLRASDFETVILRASLFTEFFVETFVGPALDMGTLRLPIAADAVLSLVSRVDVAAALAVAVDHALPTTHGALIISGPQPMELSQIARSIGLATGRKLDFESIPAAEFRSSRNALADPAWLVEAYVDLWSASIAAGLYGPPTPGLDLLIGRAHTSLAGVVGRAAPSRRADGC